MPAFNQEIEDRITEALGTIPEDGVVNLAKIAREFVVDYHALRRRYHGIPPPTTKGGHNSRLDDAQDAALIRRIKQQARHAFPMGKKAIVACAEWIMELGLGRKLEEDEHLGGHWYARWSKRHPEIHELLTKPIANNRKAALDAFDIKNWFELLRECMEEYGLDEGDLWNFDETGFQVGEMKGTLVLVPREIKKIYTRTPRDREIVTCIECISARGEAIPTFFITKGKRFMARWTDDWRARGHHPKSSWTASSSGFINEDLALEWLDHFIENAHIPQRPRRRGQHCLLLMDGHGSHLTYDFIVKCYEYGIIPFCLPPHTTHILQPLDVCVFLPYKHWHQVVLLRKVQEGIFDFGKDDFLAAQPEIKALAFKKSTILSAWRACGIVPWNPNHVLETLGQWMDEETLSEEQEVARWQVDFVPINPYAETIMVNGIRVPKKTRKEIEADVLFNHRELRRREVRQALQAKRESQRQQVMVVGENRPCTPTTLPPILTGPPSWTPSNPYELEKQREYITDQMNAYFFEDKEMSPTTLHMWKFMSKGVQSTAYHHTIQSQQLDTIVKETAKKAGSKKNHQQVPYVGRITIEQAAAVVDAREEEELRKARKRKEREEDACIRADQDILDKEWKELDRIAAEEARVKKAQVDEEIKEGNKWLMKVMREEANVAKEAAKLAARVIRAVQRPTKRRKKA
jgi:DDE superfamily endonuclease